jgi:uncharacterized protein (TIGR03545 family)
VLPRVAILAVVVLAVRFGMDPLVRWSLVSLGQRITSAKVEIGSLETSLARTEICLRDVQVADPERPMENLVEARQIKLGLETGPLLRKKFIVREGTVSGLRLGTERTTSGALEKAPRHRKPAKDKGDGGRDSRLAQLAETWLETLAAFLQDEIAEQVEQLESVRLARELARRWPREYQQMEDRADELKGRAEQLQKLVRGGARDLLRDVDSVRKALGELESIQREIAEFRGELDRLRQQALRDKDAIAQAREHDHQRIREQLRLDELRGEHLSDYLLGPELAEKVRTVAQWVRWARRYWPERAEPPEPVRARGLDVLFAGLQPGPDFLIRKLALDGQGQLDHQPFQFSGTAEGLTSQPALYGQPAVLKLEVQGAAAMLIEAVLDRTQEVGHDRITVECPELAEPRRVLGRPDRLALAISPGSTRLSLVLHLRGEELWGQVRLRQEPVELTPTVAPRYGGPRLAADLRDALARIRAVEVVADVSGTLDEPEWRLRSELGPQLAEAMNWLLGRELVARREELAALVQRRVDDELGRFEQFVDARQQALLAKLNLSSEELRQLGELAGDRLPVDKLLGKRPRIELPLRF